MEISLKKMLKLNPSLFMPYAISRTYQFEFKDSWVVICNFIQIIKEHYVSKWWGTWSDAAFCGLCSGSALFADVP